MAEKLGALVKQGRTAKGWTQAQLAQKIKGMTAADIGKIERGTKIPTTEEIRTIAKTLGVTQTSLLNAAKESKTTSGKTTSGKTTSGKTTSGKTTSAKTSSAKKTGTGKTSSASSSGTTVKVTAAEKKLLSQFRKADETTRTTVLELLEKATAKNDSAGDLLSTLLGNVLEQMIGKQ